MGGALGYLIGYALFTQFAEPLIRLYGYGPRFEAFRAMYAEWGLVGYPDQGAHADPV